MVKIYCGNNSRPGSGLQCFFQMYNKLIGDEICRLRRELVSDSELALWLGFRLSSLSVLETWCIISAKNLKIGLVCPPWWFFLRLDVCKNSRYFWAFLCQIRVWCSKCKRYWCNNLRFRRKDNIFSYNRVWFSILKVTFCGTK